ncbi:Nucleotide-diphospho-sugar transferases protein [Dioscorea alata]|uniref:Nucleotide-diphospho-sugar transferases protein n=1 Tax=Dioscorea alata TaxID=55571 RepID=A0ACB7WT99_DIOAL|nr:Nucleotide-diphospho-sugar transferases protein [Dioscorea alata]
MKLHRFPALLFALIVSTILIVSINLRRSFSLPGAGSGPVTDFSIPLPRRHTQSLALLDHPLPLRLHSQPSIDAVLFPDWETLILLPLGFPPPSTPLSCHFPNEVISPAVLSGVIPSSGRQTLRCPIPPSARSRLSPPQIPGAAPPSELLRWNKLVYESISTPDDVIVFAKGINNRRQGVNLPATELRCVFLSGDGAVIAFTPVTSSVQEVFRCPHPNLNPSSGDALRVSLQLNRDPRAFPSLATYKHSSRGPHPSAAQDKMRPPLVCACTMVRDVAKFLREWVTYHSAIGVDRFIIYDNGSEDDLESAINRLLLEGHDVSTVLWPWAKTQEAGFSHCVAAHRDSCDWMAFIDVDEFLFSPAWAASARPNRTMVRSILPTEPESDRVGQVSVPCRDFGPSGRKEHPRNGVTQGYTCRARAQERHKSVVFLRAVTRSLVNVVHHFGLGEGWRTESVGSKRAVVNHYKFQAWPEFRTKFRRRVSAYVADWRNEINMNSKDRTPGLGSEPVEPAGWERRFCEVNDTSLMELNRKWFGLDQGPMVWE